LEFENLSVVPFSRKLIDVSLLSEDQVRYIDSFHRRCFETVSPRLHNDPRALGKEHSLTLNEKSFLNSQFFSLAFLKRETQPLRPVPPPVRPKGSKMASLLAVASGAVLGGVLTYFALQKTKFSE
jgi:hypothetical protein